MLEKRRDGKPRLMQVGSSFGERRIKKRARPSNI